MFVTKIELFFQIGEMEVSPEGYGGWSSGGKKRISDVLAFTKWVLGNTKSMEETNLDDYVPEATVNMIGDGVGVILPENNPDLVNEAKLDFDKFTGERDLDVSWVRGNRMFAKNSIIILIGELWLHYKDGQLGVLVHMRNYNVYDIYLLENGEVQWNLYFDMYHPCVLNHIRWCKKVDKFSDEVLSFLQG